MGQKLNIGIINGNVFLQLKKEKNTAQKKG
jgi:hypothetical protein